MSELIQHGLSVFVAFFAIMNPISNTAVFLGLTAENTDGQKKQIAFKSLSIGFFIILAFTILGQMIFHLFGITLIALKITGGVLIFIIGYQMLHGESAKMHKGKEDEKEGDGDVAISPLAVPLLAGPGTIATAMNYTANGTWEEMAVTTAMFFLLCIVTFFSFVFGKEIVKPLGAGGLTIITRLMGLIVAVIGTQMLIGGLHALMQSYK